MVKWCGIEEWEAGREPSKRERRSHRDCEGVEAKLVYSEESEKVSGWLHTSREAKFLRPHPGRHKVFMNSLQEFTKRLQLVCALGGLGWLL